MRESLGLAFLAQSYRIAFIQGEVDLGGVGTDLRGAISDKGQDVAHVHRVGLQVGVGQAMGLLALQCLHVIIHKEDAPLHADQVT